MKSAENRTSGFRTFTVLLFLCLSVRLFKIQAPLPEALKVVVGFTPGLFLWSLNAYRLPTGLIVKFDLKIGQLSLCLFGPAARRD